MKRSLWILFGAALVSGSVLWAGGRPAGMFAAGMASMGLFCLCGLFTAWIGRIGGFLLALESALGVESSPRAATPERRKTRNPQIKTPANVVSFQKPRTRPMLSTTQQEVVSALTNLGISLSRAQETVLEASEGKPGIDFETLFRACLPARAARAAAATVR